MTDERWKAVQESDDLALTPEEIAEGWHFCWEFDGLLVGPGMGEQRFCTDACGRPVCHDCGGAGGMDSGGVTPWGSAIDVPCPSCSGAKGAKVAALFVQEDGCYSQLPTVDAWPEVRDARRYAGPLPVVAHPPCQRWGRFWHGSTRKPHQFRRGEDAGCFAAALTAVRNYGGVLEHPAGSCAWGYFGLRKPSQSGGWILADAFGGYTCQIDQRHYGHLAPKPTWLYAVNTARPELNWTKSDRTPPKWMIERYGEKKARRIGQVAMIGGKDKVKIRNATPPQFRDLLIEIAMSATPTAQGSALLPHGTKE